MKAVVYHKYGSPDVLKLDEIDKPVPKDNEVLIKIKGVAVTPADCAARKGQPLFTRLFFGLTKPKATILGTEFAGEIETVGKDVKRFAKGDQVYAASGDSFGAHAEYICLPQEGSLAIKPDNSDFVEATGICEGSLTALPFLRDGGQIKSGQKILINGASGSVGTHAIQIAKYFGAEVTAVCSTANLDLVKSLGADKTIDYTNEDFTKTKQTFDIVFDAVGKSTFSRCKGILKHGGIYLTTMISFSNIISILWTSIFGSKKAMLLFTGLRPENEKSKDLVFIKELVEKGEIRATIDRIYSLEQIAEAHGYVDQGHKKGNVVIAL